jgi:hypothetical protein
MTPAELKDALLAAFAGFDFSSVIEDAAGKPFGIVVGRTEAEDAVERAYPRIEWLPWATGRQKLEGVVKLAQFLRHKVLAIAVVPDAEAAFWTHVCRYGVLAGGAKIVNYYGPGKTGRIYYTREAANG